MNAKLDTASGLQDRFDKWSGNWFGRKKRAANAEAQSEIAQRNLEELSKVKEVFENEKFNKMSRVWKSDGFVHCSEPKREAPELFDPNNPVSMENSKWTIDFSLQGIDAEGWTYAYDYSYLNKNGAGTASAAWNSYVRRRKWKYVEKSGNEAIDGVRSRNKERANKNGAGANGTNGNVGYVARANISTLKASGLTSGGKGKQEELDDETRAGLNKLQANDAEIDAGISVIGNSLDNLTDIASAMKEETLNQHKKLQMIDDAMQSTSEKQAVVNARQRKYLG